jgi:hypothetical protein
MERLVLQLRKGAIALLPASVSTLDARAERAGATPPERWWRRLVPHR